MSINFCPTMNMSKIKDALFGAADKKSVEEAIEQGGGSGGGVLVVTATIAKDGAKNGVTKVVNPSVLIADKTVAEIREAMLSGGAVFKTPSFTEGVPEDVFSVTAVFHEIEWSVSVAGAHGEADYTAESLDDYPKREAY